jgi:hypothetical protein
MLRSKWSRVCDQGEEKMYRRGMETRLMKNLYDLYAE